MFCSVFKCSLPICEWVTGQSFCPKMDRQSSSVSTDEYIHCNSKMCLLCSVLAGTRIVRLELDFLINGLKRVLVVMHSCFTSFDILILFRIEKKFNCFSYNLSCETPISLSNI